MRSIAVLVSIWMMTLPAANAACSGNACDNEYIDMLYVQGSYVLIELSGDKSALSCTLHEGRFIRLNQSHGNYDEVYALLLATQSADRPLGRLRMSSTGNCDVAYAWQVRANIQN